MKTTSYICDTCKQSVSKSDLVTIKVEVDNILFNSENSYNKKNKSLDICKDCLKKKGFVIEAITKENMEEVLGRNSKTLEDKIIDILTDLDVCFTDHDHNY